MSLEWYKLFLEVDRFSPGYRTPAAARLLGYVGLAGYEAVVPGMDGYKSIAPSYFELHVPSIETGKDYYWPSVLNALYFNLFVNFYPNIDLAYVEKMSNLNKRFNSQFSIKIPSEILNRSSQRGIKVAEAFYEWSKTDLVGHYGFKNPQPADYTPPKGPGKWQPTTPDFSPALFPYWGKVRPFALQKNELIGRPFQYWVGEFSEDSKSPFYLQALEVRGMSKPLVYNRQWIGEFWSDDNYEETFETAGRWISIANQVINDHHSDLETSTFLYAKLGMALSDAAILIWNTKFTYNLETPVSFINRVIDPTWLPSSANPLNGLKGVTPPDPSYPSCHAGLGSAAAGILNTFYGTSYGMTDKSHETRTEFNGIPRTFASFDEMATESAISRVYLGVHFRMDIDEGLSLGSRAAEKVNGLNWK
ncbi:MAG: vanadium-dependent haloperoxidase [Saprospiraceae bacterium]